MKLVQAIFRRGAWATAMLGFLAFGTLAASCAESENQVGDREDEAGGGSIYDDGGATADAGSTCEDESTACTAQEPSCRDVDWCPVETSHDARRGLFSVWGSGKNDVWAVGAAGSVLHWDGGAWTEASVEAHRALYAVWGTSPNDIWTVSSPFEIFHTTGFVNGSVQWTPVKAIADRASDTDAQGKILRTIWGTSPSDIWVGGGHFRRSGGTLYSGAWRTVAIDGGITWTQLSLGSRDAEIRAIWGSGHDDIWLLGSPSRTSAVHTNGMAAADGSVPVWTEFDTQSFHPLNAVWGSGPGDVWAVGNYGTIRHFTAGSEIWSIVDSPTTENLRGIWGSSADDVWAVGDNGTLLHYDGTAWRTSTATFPSGEKPDLYSVWGSGPSDVWAVGGGIVMHFSGPKASAQGTMP